MLQLPPSGKNSVNAGLKTTQADHSVFFSSEPLISTYINILYKSTVKLVEVLEACGKKIYRKNIHASFQLISSPSQIHNQIVESCKKIVFEARSRYSLWSPHQEAVVAFSPGAYPI